MIDLKAKITESFEFINQKSNIKPKIAIILGTGLGRLVEDIKEKEIIPYSDIPNFPISTVQGHGGNLVLGKLENKEVLHESEHTGSLGINENKDYDNVYIHGDTVSVVCDLEVTGYTTAKQNLSHLQGKDSTIVIDVTDTYYTFKKWVNDTSENITITDSTIIIDLAGFYYVYLNSSFQSTNAIIECDLFINDVINDGSFGFKRNLTSIGDRDEASFSGVHYFNENDALKIKIKSAATGTLTATRANFGCFRLN